MSAYQALPQAQPQDSQQSSTQGITEVVLPAMQNQEYSLVLPMLAHLSQQSGDRWLTWIAPRGIHRELLLEYGFALNKLRIIYTHNDEETRRVLGKALAMGNSSTVVVSHESLGTRDIEKLEDAARQGNCQGLLLRHRGEDPAQDSNAGQATLN